MFSINQLFAREFDFWDGDTWGVLFDSIVSFISRGFYSMIICGLGRIADICQLLFRKFAGLEDMTMKGQKTSGDLVLTFLNSSIVQNVFWAMLALAVVLLFITCFVAVIKSEFNKDGNSKRPIIKNAFRAIVNFLAVPVISIFALIVGNALLAALDGATNPTGAQTTISRQIFLAGGYNSNRVRQGELENIGEYKEGSFGELVTNGAGSGVGWGSFGIFYDDTTGKNPQRAADIIDDAFGTGYSINVSTSMQMPERTLNYYAKAVDFYYIGALKNALPDGYSKINTPLVGITYAIDSTVTFNIYNIGLVNYYYDIDLGDFDYLVTTIAFFYCCFTFIKLLLGLIRRLFMLVLLFIISPPICALYPIDKGTALGKWRKEFQKNVLAAYAPIVVMNIFLLILPLLLQINVFEARDFTSLFASVSLNVGLSTSLLGSILGFANYLARIIIVVGALSFFGQACGIISNIIDADDLYKISNDGTGSFKSHLAKVAGGVGVAAGAGALALKGVGKATAKVGGAAIKGTNWALNKTVQGTKSAYRGTTALIGKAKARSEKKGKLIERMGKERYKEVTSAFRKNKIKNVALNTGHAIGSLAGAVKDTTIRGVKAVGTGFKKVGSSTATAAKKGWHYATGEKGDSALKRTLKTLTVAPRATIKLAGKGIRAAGKGVVLAGKGTGKLYYGAKKAKDAVPSVIGKVSGSKVGKVTGKGISTGKNIVGRIYNGATGVAKMPAKDGKPVKAFKDNFKQVSGLNLSSKLDKLRKDIAADADARNKALAEEVKKKK